MIKIIRNIIVYFQENKLIILTILFFIAFITFFFVVLYYNEKKWCGEFEQVGGFLLTILLTIIIMLDNNRQIEKSTSDKIKAIQLSSEKQIKIFKEESNKQISAIEEQISTIKETTKEQINAIKDSTKEQINTFINQCQGIIARLEEAVAVLVKMSSQYSESLELEKKKVEMEEKRLETLIQEQVRYSNERLQEKQKKMPVLFIRIDKQSYVIFWTHLWIYFYNKGGDAKNISIRITFININTGRNKNITKSFKEIKRSDHIKIDCGNIRDYDNYDSINAEIVTVRDIYDNEYYGEAVFNKVDETWKKISLQERYLKVK